METISTFYVAHLQYNYHKLPQDKEGNVYSRTVKKDNVCRKRAFIFEIKSSDSGEMKGDAFEGVQETLVRGWPDSCLILVVVA